MNSLIVPETGVQIVDGTIVILSRFPGTKWILHYGWYTYNSQQAMGWYFSSIPSQTIIPVTDDDLKSLTVVGTDCGCHCPPTPGPTPPQPGPGPCPKPKPVLTDKQLEILNRSWITVDTIAERDKLFEDELVVNGRIVRVNQTVDGPKYYRWNLVTETWDVETFGIDTSTFVSQSDLADAVAKEVNENPTVQSTIQTKVEESTSKLTSRVEKIETDLEWDTIS